MKTPFRLALLSCSLLAPLAFAQEGGGRPPHGPPPEALQACASLSTGAACSVTFRGETLTGTCEAPPEGTALACRPTTMPKPPDGRGPRHAPPREAVSACSGLKADAACAFTHDGNNLTGTCAAPPDGSALACRPAGPPPGPHHGPPAEAVAACASLAANAACSFTHRDQTVTGTCVAPPGGASGSLACRPDRLPPPPGQ